MPNYKILCENCFNHVSNDSLSIKSWSWLRLLAIFDWTSASTYCIVEYQQLITSPSVQRFRLQACWVWNVDHVTMCLLLLQDCWVSNVLARIVEYQITIASLIIPWVYWNNCNYNQSRPCYWVDQHFRSHFCLQSTADTGTLYEYWYSLTINICAVPVQHTVYSWYKIKNEVASLNEHASSDKEFISALKGLPARDLWIVHYNKCADRL